MSGNIFDRKAGRLVERLGTPPDVGVTADLNMAYTHFGYGKMWYPRDELVRKAHLLVSTFFQTKYVNIGPVTLLGDEPTVYAEYPLVI